MKLKEAIAEGLKEAQKSGDKILLSLLRVLNAKIINQEIAKRKKKEGLSEEEVLEVIGSELKERKDSLEYARKAEREDLIKDLEKEIVLLKKYLPEGLSKKEIEKLAREAIKEIGAADIKDLGKVMGTLMKKIKGRAEGSEVSRIVKKLLKKLIN